MMRNTILKTILCGLTLLTCGGCSLAWGQVAPAATSGSGLNAFASFGGQGTHVIAFNYKSLGFDGGVYVQASPLFGVEARFASYSIHARYSQLPVTAGYRAEKRFHQKYLFAGYGGGGVSLSQDAGPHYVATPAVWAPCFQAAQSMAIDKGRWQWKVYEATFTDTFTTRRTLPALSLTTGVVYSFSRDGR